MPKTTGVRDSRDYTTLNPDTENDESTKTGTEDSGFEEWKQHVHQPCAPSPVGAPSPKGAPSPRGTPSPKGTLSPKGTPSPKSTPSPEGTHTACDNIHSLRQGL